MTLVGSKYYLSARDISGNNAVITIARGNKFRITDAMTGSFASASRKHVAVSSKGVVSARRATNGTKIIMMNDKGETVGITVRVIKPLISANHKKTIWLKRGMNIKLAIDVPLNMYLRSIRNDGVANITGTGFNEAGKYVISGKALTRGTIIVRMKVNNRNYWVKIGVL